jgi:predicted small secreted protein
MRILMMMVVVAFGVSGCETFKGIGRDITGTAETVQGWFN